MTQDWESPSAAPHDPPVSTAPMDPTPRDTDRLHRERAGSARRRVQGPRR